jgi:hypothetical protein
VFVEFMVEVTVAALAVGLLVGLTGVGAGALMTPLLIVVFGVSAPVAIATDLLYATITKLVGGVAHMRSGHIQWKLLRPLWVGGVVGAAVGTVVVITTVQTTDSFDWLKYPLAALIALAAVSLFRRHLLPSSQVSAGHRGEGSRGLALAGGAGIGVGVAMTSVGAGALGMALLTKLSPRDTPSQRLVGTDLLLAVPIALLAGVSYLVAGLVDFSLLVSLLVGSLPGVLLGSVLSTRFSSRYLGVVVAAALSAAVVALLVS